MDQTISVLPVDNFVQTCIAGFFEGFSYETVFELCNGQVWRQTDFTLSIAIAIRPDVLIFESPFGGTRMKVEGENETISVTQLQ